MRENKYAPEDLKTMQAWSLERKIQVTQTRLIEWYQKFQGKVYVSFSGGEDSTVLLHIARQLYPDIEAVFVDTGLEYPEIREFVKSFDNVTWLGPFQSTPSVGRATAQEIKLLEHQGISIHALRGEGDHDIDGRRH